VKQCFAIRAGDSGIWQTPTLGDSDTSSRAVGFILIYLERAHMVLEIAGEQHSATPHDVRHFDKRRLNADSCPY